MLAFQACVIAGGRATRAQQRVLASVQLPPLHWAPVEHAQGSHGLPSALCVATMPSTGGRACGQCSVQAWRWGRSLCRWRVSARSLALPPDTWRGELENGSRLLAGRAALVLSLGAAPDLVCLRQVMGAQEGKAKPGGGISELNRFARPGWLPARLARLAVVCVLAPCTNETLRVATVVVSVHSKPRCGFASS